MFLKSVPPDAGQGRDQCGSLRTHGWGREMKVLVVDDDIVSRMVLMHLVDSCGAYEIVEAGDGEDAWNQLQLGLRPAICFCDLRMPRLSGMVLLERIKAAPALESMRFVLASSASDQATMVQASSLGADGYLVKPFQPDQVSEQLAQLRPRFDGDADIALATMQRLGISDERLLLYLDGLERQLDAAGREIAPLLAVGEQDVVNQRIERLHAGCVTLGLHGAAARFAALARDASDGYQLQAALDAARQQAGRCKAVVLEHTRTARLQAAAFATIAR
jgi:two-component system chemotaxis response regulator CheY